MIHLTITVSNTDELLNASAYGAGALLRWESCATVDGTYVEGGTVALVSGTSLYEVWHTAGVASTFYRTRISDGAGTSFSPYSEPFQSQGVLPSLSPDQFRLFVTTTLTDEALILLLDAAMEAIVTYAGPWGEISERYRPHGDLILLSRTPLSITSVIETAVGSVTGTTLAANDYVIRGQTLRRLSTGTNPSWGWGWTSGFVDVTYTPADDMAERQRVQMELAKLSINAASSGGGILASQTIGTWSETYQSRTGNTYQAQRQEILSSLGAGSGSYEHPKPSRRGSFHERPTSALDTSR